MRQNWDDPGEGKHDSLLPTGIHEVVVVTAEEKPWKNDLNQLEVTFEAVSGEYEGKQIRDWLYQGGGAFRIVWLFGKCGIKLEGDMEANPQDLIGKTLAIDVKAEKYNEKLRNKVKGYYRIEEAKDLLAKGTIESDPF